MRRTDAGLAEVRFLTPLRSWGLAVLTAGVVLLVGFVAGALTMAADLGA